MLVDGPSPEHELVLQGRLEGPGARHRPGRLSDRLRSDGVSRRRAHPRAHRRRAAATTWWPRRSPELRPPDRARGLRHGSPLPDGPAMRVLYLWVAASSKVTRVGRCPLFVFQGTCLRRAAEQLGAACATPPSAWRGATGSRCSTSSCGANRSAWCCGSSSIGRTAGVRRERPKTAVGIEDCQRVSQDLSALLDVEDEEFGAARRSAQTYTLEVSSPGSIGRCGTRRTTGASPAGWRRW